MIFALIFAPGSLCAQYVVHESKEISEFEKKVLLERFPLIKKTVEKCVGVGLYDQDVPSIGVVASGGGCRATIASLAFVDALDQLGFLDACSHISTLSGSTWMLGSLLSHKFSLSELRDYLQKSLAQESLRNDLDVAAIFKQLKAKYYCNQTITMTDIYGCILEHIFLKYLTESDNSICLSHTRDFVASGKYPYPLFTALLTNFNPREFIEFSPAGIGSADVLGLWVDPEDFDKKFSGGVSNDESPEQSLGFLLGIFGSAFAFGFSDAYNWLIGQLKNHWYSVSVPNDTEEYLRHTELYHGLDRLTQPKMVQNLFQTAARVNNFTKDMDKSPIKDADQLMLVDGGMRCNLPFAPLLIPARNVNLYLVCDVSGGTKSEGIKTLEEYAHEKGYKLPLFDYDKINNNEVCLFYDDKDATVPVVVYIPHVADPSTIQFRYSEQEFNDLYDSMNHLVLGAKETILDGMKIAVGNAKKRSGNDRTCTLF